jgi:hypothetical protein
MLLSQEKSLVPRCKVAKHILFPKTGYGNIDTKLLHSVKRFYASNIHITHNRYTATLYYMFKDIICFYNTRTSYLRSLVPLYDYTNGKYSFWEVGLNYKASKAISKSWYCVKAPNGNIYVVYAILHSNNRGALCVYNLSKDKTLYCVTYRTNAFSASNLKAHPDEYSYILANSFVVIYKIEETGIYIYLIDLVSGKVDELSYTLYDYLKSLSNVVNNETDKQLINDMLSSPDFKLQIDNYYFSLLWDVEHVECIIDNHEKTVPFVKFLKLYFRINNIGAIYKRVDNALSVSFTLENNELFVQFGTGTGGAIEKTLGSTFKVTIPSNIVLSSKRYNLNSSYDISKSYPYYIYKVTQNYIFTRRYVFEQSPRKSHEYILNPELSDLYKGHNLYTIDSINLLKKKNNTIAQLNNNYSRQKLGVYIIGVDNNINPKLVNFVDLHKASPFLQKETYVDISNYTFDLNVFDKIMSSMSIEKEEIKSIESRIFIIFY